MRRSALVSLTAALFAGTASADTLREALVSTYATNPTITNVTLRDYAVLEGPTRVTRGLPGAVANA